jgi:hypothetical protein
MELMKLELSTIKVIKLHCLHGLLLYGNLHGCQWRLANGGGYLVGKTGKVGFDDRGPCSSDFIKHSVQKNIADPWNTSRSGKHIRQCVLIIQTKRRHSGRVSKASAAIHVSISPLLRNPCGEWCSNDIENLMLIFQDKERRMWMKLNSGQGC